MQTSGLIRPTLSILAFVYCVAIALVLTKGRIVSGSVDISYHLQVLEAVRGRWIVPESAKAYLAEMYFYPKLSHRLAGWAGATGLGPLWGLAAVAALSAALGWLALLNLARRVSWLLLLAALLLSLAAARWTGAVLGAEIVDNFFFPQLVAEAVCLLGLWAGAALVWRSPRAFALFAPAATFFCGWFHLVGTLKLAGALAALAGLRLLWEALHARRFHRWSLAAMVGTAVALFVNPSFAVMRRLSTNNGSVNFGVDLTLPELGGLAGALVVLCAAGLGLLLADRRRLAQGEPGSERNQALAALLALGLAAGAAALAQWFALAALGEGSVYAVRKHGFGVITALCFAAPGVFWLAAAGRRARERRLPAPLALALLAGGHAALMVGLFARPTQLDAVRLAEIMEALGRVRPAGEAGGVSHLFVTTRHPPVVGYMGTIAELRAERGPNALAVLATGHPGTPETIPYLVTVPGDPTYDDPQCRRGPPIGPIVVVDGACVAPSATSFKAGGEGAAFLVEGWSAPEAGGVWSAHSRAVLRVPLGPEVQALPNPKLQISAFGFTPPESPRRTVVAQVEGGPAETFVFDRQKALTHLFVLPIPQPALARGEAVVVFEIEDAVSPESLGLGPDPRRLGVGLEWIRILPKPRSRLERPAAG